MRGNEKARSAIDRHPGVVISAVTYMDWSWE
jgi:hypothetical protein